MISSCKGSRINYRLLSQYGWYFKGYLNLKISFQIFSYLENWLTSSAPIA